MTPRRTVLEARKKTYTHRRHNCGAPDTSAELTGVRVVDFRCELSLVDVQFTAIGARNALRDWPIRVVLPFLREYTLFDDETHRTNLRITFTPFRDQAVATRGFTYRPMYHDFLCDNRNHEHFCLDNWTSADRRIRIVRTIRIE